MRSTVEAGGTGPDNARRSALEGAENLRRLGKGPAERAGAFGMRRAGLGPTGGGMIFGLWA
jgi:hypothetical protein